MPRSGSPKRQPTGAVEHRNTIIIGAIVAIIVIGGVRWRLVLPAIRKIKRPASTCPSRSVPCRPSFARPGTPEQPDFPTFTSAKERSQAAQKQFQAIIDKYPHTRTADMAHYLLGVTQKDLGDSAGAERNFKQVMSNGNKEVASVAKDALAALYADTNRNKDAIALYQELMNKPTTSVSKVTAQLQLAELLPGLQPAARRQEAVRANQERQSRQ